MVYLTEKGKQYLEEWRRLRNDFNSNLPGFIIEEFPVSRNEGLYGWTFVPPDGKIRRREDLGGGIHQGKKTDLHELGHDKLNDGEMCEYVTRLLTEERMKSVVPEEKIKYGGNHKDYPR
ncbi:hypothetical protein KY306_00085 [Candidatus Woesearchaeota archaeon]|nr:hypothetical protein [Candidatus Woesearchaeota archaeon]